MSTVRAIRQILILCLPACSQPDFSAGSSKVAKETPKKASTTPVKTKTLILLASDLKFANNSEGTPGTCNQQFLGVGKNLLNETIIPALKNKGDGGFTDLQLATRSDVLIDVAALSCDKSASSWIFTSNVMICQRNLNGLGANSLEQGFGTSVVCGERYPNQTPFAPSDDNIKTLSGSNLSGENHLYIVTYKLGSSIPAENFLSLVRKKLGSTLKVSIIYPKNPSDCVTRGINPPSTDLMWKALPASASGPSAVFEDIAAKTGGSTYDLCNTAGLEKL